MKRIRIRNTDVNNTGYYALYNCFVPITNQLLQIGNFHGNKYFQDIFEFILISKLFLRVNRASNK